MNQAASDAFREASYQASPTMAVYYREYGEDRSRVPVVCLHGYWRTSKDFEELAAHLAPRRRVVVPDLRGRGRSSRSVDSADYDLARLEDDVRGLLAELGIGRAVFVGLALGAQLAMDIAARTPELVAGIVFNDSAPETVAKSGRKMAAFSGGEALRREEAMDRVRAQYAQAFPSMDEWGFERLLYRNYRLDDEGRHVRDFDQLTNEALVRTKEARPDFWAEYDRIADVPVLVLRGENSDFITPEVVERMLVGRSLAKEFVIPGAGHPAMLWEPEAFEAIDDLLASVDRGDATSR